MKNQTYHDQAVAHLATLKKVASESGITQQAIADKTGWTQTNVSRMLLGKYIPRYDNLLKLADAIGVKIVLKTLALLLSVNLVSCEQEIVIIPDCPNITITARSEGQIHFVIDSPEPYVTICDPDTGHCTTIQAHYYKCVSMPITSVLIVNDKCTIQ